MLKLPKCDRKMENLDFMQQKRQKNQIVHQAKDRYINKNKQLRLQRASAF
jgi:hypothetical protein